MARARNERPEKLEERKFVKRIRDLNSESLKQGGAGPYGIGGYNDQMVLLPLGTCLFIEFKRIINGKLEEPTERQKSRHRKLKKLGFQTYVVGSAKRAFKLCRKALQANGAPKAIWTRFR